MGIKGKERQHPMENTAVLFWHRLQIDPDHGTIEIRGEAKRGVDTMLMKTENRPVVVSTGHELAPIKRLPRARFALAFAVAAVSDFLSIWLEFAPPAQWLLDLGTAGLLFVILGRRWALLPGLIVEAIPGMGVFPVWILVVLSLVVYDEIKVHRRS
jgi:hypothetical protein